MAVVALVKVGGIILNDRIERRYLNVLTMRSNWQFYVSDGCFASRNVTGIKLSRSW